MKKKKKIILIISIIILLLVFVSIIFVHLYHVKKEEQRLENIKIKEQKQLKEITNSYNKYVKVNKNTYLYVYDNNKYKKAGNISENVELELNDIDNFKDEYFKLKNLDYYVYYKDITKIEKLEIDNTYKNYIVFNENIITNSDTKFYIKDNIYYQVNESLSLPIIIKDDDKYYIEYDNKLVYVYKDNIIKTENVENTPLEVATDFAVLGYHYTISYEENENKECKQSICIRDTLFDKHMSYIKENKFYTASMKDVEMFLDNKIRLPKKTVVITIDDGWYVPRSINILEKYKLHATLFLIGNLAPVNNYQSDYLEVHSHSWNMHNLRVCDNSNMGSPFLCLNKNDLLEDLKKSRESLNNTSYFCWPFYEYNSYSINVIKEAGFTMAFAGGNKKVTKKSNRYALPRYGMINTTTVSELAEIIN